LDMARKPELIIGYEESFFFSPAVCSARGKKLPKADPWVTSAKGAIRWFRTHFDMRPRQRHSREGANKSVLIRVIPDKPEA